MTGTFDGGQFVGGYSPTGFVTDKFRSEYEEQWDGGRFVGDQDDYIAERMEIIRRDPPTLGRTRSSRDWYSDEEYQNSAFNKIFMEPGGTGHWTTLVFALNGSRLAALMFFENKDDSVEKDFEGLRQTLDVLSPHVVRATRIARALYMAKEAAETYKGFLDAIALPLLITDSGRILQMANSAGQRLLERGELFQVSQIGRLTLIDAYDSNKFRETLLDVERHNDARGMRIDHKDGLISLCVAPFHPSMATQLQAELDVFDQEQLLAIFAGAQGDHAVNPGLLQDVFHLTAREADVCGAVVAGLNPAQIAQETGRAEKTIRNQIQSAYEKIGVTSSRELADALSVFRTVGAMFDRNDPHLFGPQHLPGS
ncbi:MAG: LuxR C-terminal-related transcriptional regulator [Pseudomonadota bacterium]